MNSWLQSMKQWTQWLMGEAPLPDGRSKAMLAGTVASVAAIAVGVPAAIPSTPAANAAVKPQSSASSDAASSQYTVPSSTVAPSSVIAAGSTTSTTSSAYYVEPDPFVKAKKVRRHDRHHGDKTTATGTPGTHTSSTAPLAAPLVAAPVEAPATATATTTVPAAGQDVAPTPTPLVPVDPIPTLVAPATPPAAPLATGAQSFVGSAVVTWKAPAGSTATGYDVYLGLAPGMEYPIPVNGTDPVVGNSYLVTGLTPGRTYYFTVRGRTGATSSAPSNEVTAFPFNGYTPVGHLVGPVISMASTADGTGYWLASANGAVSPHGSATDLGSPTALTLAAPIQKIVADPKADGYWEVAADGGVFAYGAAPFEGAASSLALNSQIVDLVPTADGLGYFEVAADGGVFAYGDATFAGSLGATPQASPTVGMALDGATGGYWLVAADGDVSAFDAPALGPQVGDDSVVLPPSPVVGLAATTDGKGIWEVTNTGGVYAYGDATFQGPNAPLDPAAPVTSVTADPSGSGGYWLVSADGGVYAFGSTFYGAG